MYLNPPCETFKEFKERLGMRELFRVYPRPVKLRTRDLSFRRKGESTVTMSDGTEVVCVMLNGKVIIARPLDEILDLPEYATPTVDITKEVKPIEKGFEAKELWAILARHGKQENSNGK